MRFALFFMGEYAAMIAGSALMVVLFCGGWTLPLGDFFNTPAQSLPQGLVHIGVFIAKIAMFLGLMIWVSLDVAAIPLRSTDEYWLETVPAGELGQHHPYGNRAVGAAQLRTTQ